MDGGEMCEKDISQMEVFTGAYSPPSLSHLDGVMCSLSCMAFSSGARELTLSPSPYTLHLRSFPFSGEVCSFIPFL